MPKDLSERRIALPLVLWAGPICFLGLFYFYPLASILAVSLGRSQAGWSAPFREAITSPSVWGVLWFTVWQAALSTILTLLVGLPGAYLLARYNFRGKSLLQALTGIPFVMPTLVVAASFYALLGPRGWINLALMNILGLTEPPFQFINTIFAILVAHVVYNTTIVLRIVGDFWSHIDPRMEQAARTLGASSLKTWRYVTLPLLAPAIAAATLLVFIFDFTSFGVILVLGGPRYATLEVEIYNQTVALFNLPMAAVLSLIQLTCTLILIVVYTRLASRLTRPQTLRPRLYTQRKLLTSRSRIYAGLIVAYLVCLLVTPLLSLAFRSFTSLETDRARPGVEASPIRRGFTLAYYRELSANRRNSIFFAPPATAIGVSVAYATVTVGMALLLGIPASWALARDPLPGDALDSITRRTFDPLLMLPLGTSPVTLGLGFIVALDRPPLDLRASPILVPLAHTLVAFPFVVRSLVPALRSIRPRIRQAARVTGASPWQVFRYVDLPLVGRAVLAAAIFAFTISLGEFGATVLIARPEYPTIPIAIYRFISSPGALNYGQALALSTILMVVCAAGMLSIERLRIAEVGEF
jgi:thiamine transport system permease protein